MKRVLLTAIAGCGLAAIAAAVVFLWSPGGDDVLSAEAAVQQACNTMQNQDYDILDTISLPDMTVSIRISYSGKDQHRRWFWRNNQGEVLAKAEQILKSGTMYTRETAEGDPSTWESWDVNEGWPTGGHYLPCFPADREGLDSNTFGYMVEPSGERRFTYSSEIHEGGDTLTRDFWVDSSGQPVRGRKTFTSPGETNPHLVINGTFSGFGEANTITAPVVGGQ